jgi:hypothetical protein
MNESATIERERPARGRLAANLVTSLVRDPAGRQRVRAIAKRARRAFRIVSGWFPLTPLGLAAIPGLIALLRVYGVGHNDRIVLVLGACGLLVIGLSVLAVAATALWLLIRRQAPAQDALIFEVGTPFRTGYSVGHVGWNPFVKIDVAWDQPSGVAVDLVPGRSGFTEVVAGRERALHHEVVRWITVCDVFRLSRLRFRKRRAQPITILPSSGKVRGAQLVQQFVPGDEVAHPEGKPEGDLIEMRRYSPGDPLKLVLWKVYARTGRMLVRTPERAVARSQKTLAYLVAAEGDEPAAGVARAVLEGGSLGNEFWFSADGQGDFTRTARAAVDQVVRSSSFRDQGGEGLGRFLGRGEEIGVSACLLFLPARPGDWLARVEGHLGGHRGPYRAMIGIDGLEQLGPPSTARWLRSLLVRPESSTEASLAGLREVCERIAKTGAEVNVVDRTTGRTYLLAELPAAEAARPVKGGRS